MSVCHYNEDKSFEFLDSEGRKNKINFTTRPTPFIAS